MSHGSDTGVGIWPSGIVIVVGPRVVPSLRTNVLVSVSGPTAWIAHVNVNKAVPAPQSIGPLGNADVNATALNIGRAPMEIGSDAGWEMLPMLIVNVTT